MGNINSSKLILYLFITLSFLLIIISSFLFYSLARYGNEFESLGKDAQKLNLISDIRSNTGFVQISILRYVATDNAAESDLQKGLILSTTSVNDSKYDELQTYIEPGEESQQYQKTIQSRAVYVNSFEQLLSLAAPTLADKLAFNIQNVRPAYDNYSTNLVDLSTEVITSAQANQSHAQNQINLLQKISIGLIALTLLIVLGLALLTLIIINRLRADKVHLEIEMERRKKAIAELEASNKELESFSYSVSHDLRTPLRSLEGFSEALAEDYRDVLDEEGKKFLQRIQDASILMGHLIDDLLKLSRITRSDMQRETVNLSGIAESVIQEIKQTNPESPAEFIVQPGIIASGDPRLLRIAMENLIGNAWKFTSRVKSPRIEIGVINQKGIPTYFVKDNGAGFDMAYAGKLFQPFQRLHKSTDFPGTGIGLATVQRVIRRHGGKVWAEGKPGEGATFYFTLNQESGS